MAKSTSDGRVSHEDADGVTQVTTTSRSHLVQPTADPTFQAAADAEIARLAEQGASRDRYDDMSKDDLIAECHERDLAVSGTKRELADRLRAADKG